MTWLFSRAGRFLAALGALIATGLGLLAVGRRQGATGAKAKARDADAKGANQIERKADEARDNPGTGSADDRLRAHDRLRDE